MHTTDLIARCGRPAAALALALGGLAAGTAHAQDRIYRCGNEYTNNAAVARERGCRQIEGGNVTIVQGTRPNGGSASPPANPADGARTVAAPSAPATVRSDAAASEQRARDADARAILEGELRRAQQRQAELRKEYNDGEPEKLGPETRNYQKYLDRVADLKAQLIRNENDIAGLQREIARIPGGR
ncbi:MAG: hypothetical protein PGN26_10660 [Xylophilus ampelinus]